MKMKKMAVTVQCLAVYNSTIEVPEDMSLEEAIDYAEANLDEILLGELEYVPDSDELDRDSCEFIDSSDETSTEENFDEEEAPENHSLNGVEYLWDVFDDIARKHNYHLTIIDESVRDEERANFGKAMSVMGTVATNENGDLFTPFIRINVFLSEGQGSILVIDRNGNFVLSGRELKRYNFTDYTNVDEFVEKVNSFFEEYKQYNSKNKVK